MNSRSDLALSRTDAEKIVELLEGFALWLQSEPPERLIEMLSTLDQTGVYSPLRYGSTLGPPYVAEEADAVRARLTEALGGAGDATR